MTEHDSGGEVLNGVTASGRTLSRGGRTSFPLRHARLRVLLHGASRGSSSLRAKTVKREPAR